MGIFSKLFGRTAAQANAAAPPASPDTHATVTAERPEPPAAAPEPEPALPTEGKRPAVPLRALEGYRRDPAFQNFMEKARRPPGVGNGRPRRPRPPDDGAR